MMTMPPDRAADAYPHIAARLNEIEAERAAALNRVPEQCPACGVGVLAYGLGGLVCLGCGVGNQ